MEITIKKFKRHEDVTFSVPAEISGGNELGKTTILEAISFVLTGKNFDGKEFVSLYDNRKDLHDANAHVIFTDDFGNSYERLVSPVFKTTRSGEEQISILRNTVCKKNGIPCNDFSPEFSDFLKFGTDFFFLQKDDEKRKIFIDALKSKMPDYDINMSIDKLKELKRSQKREVNEIDNFKMLIKNTVDLEVPEIDEKSQQSENEYQKILDTIFENSELILTINKKNNSISEKYNKDVDELDKKIKNLKDTIGEIESDLLKLEKEKTETENRTLSQPDLIDVDFYKKDVETIKTKLSTLEFFENLTDYAKKYMQFNPVCCENIDKIEEIKNRVFVFDAKNNSTCPITREACSIAFENAEISQKNAFDLQNESEIKELKAKNGQILNAEMQEKNNIYLAEKSKLELAEMKLLNAENQNKKQLEEFERCKLNFDRERSDDLFEIKNKQTYYLEQKNDLEKTLQELKNKEIEKPIFEKLPENLEVSDEMKLLHADFLTKEQIISEKKAVNANNKINVEKYNAEIKEHQKALFEISESIIKIQREISDYFSNLSNLVKTSFQGDNEIDVKLLKYVIANDEWKDCFIITSDGKEFPHECNGALVNNVKLQILNGLQKLNGYKGITVIDNCEANTTQPINILDVRAVVATANFYTKLTIKQK